MRQSDGAVVMSKSKMNPSDAPTFYEIDLMAVKPGKGFYELTLTSTPSKANAKLTGNEGALLLVKVLGTVSLENVEIGNFKKYIPTYLCTFVSIHRHMNGLPHVKFIYSEKATKFCEISTAPERGDGHSPYYANMRLEFIN